MNPLLEFLQKLFKNGNGSRIFLVALILSFALGIMRDIPAWTNVNFFIASVYVVMSLYWYRENISELGLKQVAPFLILILGFFTYFNNYDQPNHLFWDENYYLTAATKYEKGIFFEESHPPFAKLLIAAGDSLVNANPGMTVDFEKADFTKNTPEGFSFRGMRFFPAFFAWMNALMFFALLIALTQSAAWSLSLSFLYLLDNALIVHSRGTMLDSIQIFGILLALLSYFKCYRDGRFRKRWVAGIAVGVGWAMWTKLNGLIIILCFPLMLLLPTELPWRERFRRVIPHWGLGALVLAIWSIGIWRTHFALGQKIEPSLQNQGWYKASDELKDIKLHPENHPNFVANFAVELKDYLFYMKQYAAGVPELNMCKKGENGSPFYWWPFGARTISYRWETRDSGEHVSYLYMVPNPVAWGIGLLAVILSLAYFLMKPLFKEMLLEDREQSHIVALSLLWLSYMISIARIERVMYTYHYFIPLIFSFALAAKWVPLLARRLEIPRPLLYFFYRSGGVVSTLVSDTSGSAKRKDSASPSTPPTSSASGVLDSATITQVFLMLALTAGWNFYRPMTYYYPITCSQFKSRAIFSGWQMRGIKCDTGYDRYKVIEPPPPPPVSSAPAPISSALSETSAARFQLRDRKSRPSKPHN